ncbi:MAG: hypothetical protein ITG01_01955 [Comamonas sp.]|jgi:hypothetical protein|nr:hypothetical protein [Comamonas sp.]
MIPNLDKPGLGMCKMALADGLGLNLKTCASETKKGLENQDLFCKLAEGAGFEPAVGY